MAANSKIEWTDHTFNPWTGCTKVGPGCDGCYAESWARRSGTVQWGPQADRRRTTPANWRKPLQWEAGHSDFMTLHNRRQRVFCASLADVFDNQVPPIWRAELFELIAATPHLDWLLLTKRIGNAWKMMADACGVSMASAKLPLPNVWLGATIVDQAEADRDIPKLLATPAAVRFLSMEPMLGHIDLSAFIGPVCDRGSAPGPGGYGGVMCSRCQGLRTQGGCPGLDWIICGGESGPQARPMAPAWAQSLRDQCAAAGVPFLFKQWGEWLGAMQDGNPDAAEQVINASDSNQRIGKKAAGRLLDGRTHDGFPA